jgi:hypothetical protein
MSKPQDWAKLNNLVVISTSRQLFTAAGVVLHTLRKDLKLGDLVEETDQILLRHGDHRTASTVILTTDQIRDRRKSQKILTFCFMPSATKALTIGDLEAGFSTYCQALRRLVADGRDLNAIRRTVCWDYLNRIAHLASEGLPLSRRTDPAVPEGGITCSSRLIQATPSLC